MKITCFECSVRFKPGESNTKIIGPDIEITCPFCFYKYKGKITSFIRDQLGGFKIQSAKMAADMIQLAEYIEINSSDYYKKRGLRHGGRKKVRNLRD